MASPDNLLAVTHIAGDIETYLGEMGEVFRAFREQDSGCTSYGVQHDGRRYFVKRASLSRGQRSLARAVVVNRTARHRALPGMLNVIDSDDGLVLVYEWAPGELLGRQGGDAGDRFRRLDVRHQLAAVAELFDVHVLLADLGFIAVDLYDGCFIYDFDAHRLRLCDLDEYHAAPFTLDRDRLPGSTRFMAPEEFVRGSRIDQVTNVFALGRAAMVLLGDLEGTAASWRASPTLLAVVQRATSPDRATRQQSVRQLVDEWHATLT